MDGGIPLFSSAAADEKDAVRGAAQKAACFSAQEVKGRDVNRVRGIVMLLAGCFALYEGWRMLTGRRAVVAIILGIVALGLAAWHLTRKEPKRLV